jgi:hypothetical protein
MTEQELFDFLRTEGLDDLRKAEDEFSTYDCTFSADARFGTVRYYAELKCRDRHYDELLIEESKYRRLMAVADYHGRVPVYICSTPEGIWGWNLHKVPVPNWEAREMPATTEFENTEKVMKVVGYLPISSGRRML